MRQIMNQKKTTKLAKELSLPIIKVMVRGGSDHAKDLCLNDGTVVTIHRDGSQTKSPYGWQ